MFTSFILCHIDGEQVMINVMDISYVAGSNVFLRSRGEEDMCLTVDEPFDEINNKLCEELNGL